MIATAMPIEHLGWTVFTEQPRAVALRQVYASVVTSIVVVLLGIAAAVAASFALGRRMVQPIRQIEAGARELGEGRLDRRLDVRTGDELEALGAQFNRMAERLQAIYATQETRIAERTHELARANEAKSRFVAAASHDLRQPMHALSLFVGQLRAAAGSPQGPALLEKIEHSVDTLQELLESLLDLSKLDMGAVKAEPKAFGAHELLSRLVDQLAPLAEAKGLALTLVPTSLWIWSDPLLLERILLNIIANAIRYTYEGRVLIGCRRRGGRVEVVIADTGVGIDAIHLPNIFQEFYRAAPGETSTRGLGLGLAIVNRLALLLRHDIRVDSVPGKGTLVRITVSRAPAATEEPVAGASVVQDLCGARVLVVDDDVAARDSITGLLEQWGCAVMSAKGLASAIECTRDWRPDVVLCDVALAAGATGVDVVEQLRSTHGSGLACAWITGESSPDLLARLRARGDPIAFKPLKPAKLRAIVEHLRGR